MNLFTEIQYLFCSVEHENIPHSERMEKLRELIDKNNKEVRDQGWRAGVLESKEHIEKLLNEL